MLKVRRQQNAYALGHDLNLEKSLALFLPEAFFDKIITGFSTSLLRSNVEIRQMHSNGEKSCS